MKKLKVAFFIAIVAILSGLVLFNVVSKNQKILFTIAAVSDDPSNVRYFALDRIYKLMLEGKNRKKIIDQLLNNNNDGLNSLYIRVVGVAGIKEATGFLVKAYVSTQDDKNKRGLQHYIIDSMGLLGNDATVVLLERLLENYDKHPLEVTQYSIARALYLQTGKKYYYIDSFGKKSSVTETDELVKARNVVNETKDRKRTLDEMILLDKLFRR